MANQHTKARELAIASLPRAASVSPGSTKVGTIVRGEVVPAWKDPVVIFQTLLSINAALTLFAGAGLINLVAPAGLAALITAWVTFLAGIITIVLKAFFSKNPISFNG